MLPATNKAQVTHVPIQLILDDFLRRHGKGVEPYDLPESPHVLRQEHFPDDARVLFAYLDEDDTTREAVLADLTEHLRLTIQALPAQATEGADPNPVIERQIAVRQQAVALLARTLAALERTPTRHLVVGIASETFDAVQRGSEPHLPFVTGHFRRPTPPPTPPQEG